MNNKPENTRNDIKQYIQERNNKHIVDILVNLHAADIAKLLDGMAVEEQNYVLELLDNERSSAVLLELDEDDRREILKTFTPKEIAREVLEEIDTDDAADILSELSEATKNQVIAQMTDVEHAKDIVELLRYDEDTAGGLMAKELIKVNHNWDVLKCVKEMRKQAETLDEVKSIYVVDEHDVLLGILSLRKLLTTSTRTQVEQIYNPNIYSVGVTIDNETVANIMSKYDLSEMPVVDEMNRLVGRISIDDVVDVIKEEAEKDYQLASGISQDVDADDSILKLTRARLPWLVLALIGGVISVKVLGLFNNALTNHPELFFFTPLIAAMAGNIGVQSSAIVVQALANNSLKGSLWNRLIKEVLLSLFNGIILAFILIFLTYLLLDIYFSLALTVTVSLVSVIIIASLIGTFIPIFLNRIKIDPALATGPFITTSNDICGILIYFTIARCILGF